MAGSPSSHAAMRETLPIVDLESPGDLLALERACRGPGVFYLRASPHVAACEERLFAMSRDFFALPLAERMTVALTPGGTTGYVPPDAGRHDVLFCVFPPREGELPAALRIEPNKWPAIPGGLAAAAEAYLGALYPLGPAL